MNKRALRAAIESAKTWPKNYECQFSYFWNAEVFNVYESRTLTQAKKEGG